MFEKVEIGECTLYLGDCYDVLKDLPSKSVTLVHSDPPYVIHSGSQKSEWYDKIGVGYVYGEWNNRRSLCNDRQKIHRN